MVSRKTILIEILLVLSIIKGSSEWNRVVYPAIYIELPEPFKFSMKMPPLKGDDIRSVICPKALPYVCEDEYSIACSKTNDVLSKCQMQNESMLLDITEDQWKFFGDISKLVRSGKLFRSYIPKAEEIKGEIKLGSNYSYNIKIDDEKDDETLITVTVKSQTSEIKEKKFVARKQTRSYLITKVDDEIPNNKDDNKDKESKTEAGNPAKKLEDEMFWFKVKVFAIVFIVVCIKVAVYYFFFIKENEVEEERI